jgi:hypothetical protein
MIAPRMDAFGLYHDDIAASTGLVFAVVDAGLAARPHWSCAGPRGGCEGELAAGRRSGSPGS